jgi:hypothetical protein
MATRMQQRRGTQAQWTAANPVLAAGEIGFEIDNNRFKVGDGTNHWDDLNYFVDIESVLGGVSGTDLPAALDTLNEIAAALNDDAGLYNTLSNLINTGIESVGNNLSVHAGDASNVHGVADMTVLTTETYVANAITTHAGVTSNVHGIANTLALATTTSVGTSISTALETVANNLSQAISNHNADTSDVHGIANTNAIVYTTDSRLSDERTPSSSSVTASKIASDAVETGKIANAAVTVAKLASDSVETAKIKDGAVTDAKLANGIAQSKITDLVSNLSAKLESSTAATTYAPIASPTFTGTVSGVTKSHVGLGNVDNTTDALKPVSTATQTALDAKLALAGGTMTGALTLSADPSSDLHAATKQYVDAATAGLNVHASVKVATTANVNLANAIDNNKTIDGYTLSTGDRILVKNQSTAADNGVYIVASNGAPTRATDYNQAGEVDAGDFIFIENGTVNGKTGWIQTNLITTLGTDAIAFTQFSGAGTYSAGSALTLTGSTFSIADGAITSAKIADGAIVDADVNASAAIAQSKISGLTSDLAAKAPIASPTFTGLVTVAANGIAYTDGTQTKEGVPSRTPIISKTDSYTLSATSERDSLIEVNKSSGSTITIPLNSAVAFPVGTTLDILQTGTGQVTIAGDSGVTVNATPGLKLRTQWSSATLFKRDTNVWVVFGDLSA